jgi:protein-ribulosamine 3-kinase
MLPLPVSKSIAAFLTGRTGENVLLKSTESLGGGCINNAAKVSTTVGVFFVKYNTAASYPQMFALEANGLQLLRDADEIRVPEVIHYDTAENFSFLLLEFITSENRVHHFWSIFGRALASLHKHTNSFFGLDHDNFIGSLSQRNRLHKDWTGFFVTERLEPMVKQARDKGEISTHLVNQFECLYNKLSGYLPEEKPALLHGDLWSGNYMVDDKGDPCLIDPAVYFGHREMDLAMTRLFGGFSPQFYESYNHAFTLEKGWEERLDIMNLYPLMVHVNLFGGGYVSEVKQILDHFV